MSQIKTKQRVKKLVLRRKLRRQLLSVGHQWDTIVKMLPPSHDIIVHNTKMLTRESSDRKIDIDIKRYRNSIRYYEGLIQANKIQTL